VGEDVDAIRKTMDRARSEMAWYEEIAAFDEPMFSRELDTVAWQIYSLGGFDAGLVPIDFQMKLTRSDHRAPLPEPVPPEDMDQLLAIRDEAERRARERGWNPASRLAVIRDTVRRRWES
jgi:hypothetical protein